MKKVLALTMAAMFSLPSLAHEVWVDAGHTHGGEILKASLGYGDFPALADIP